MSASTQQQALSMLTIYNDPLQLARFNQLKNAFPAYIAGTANDAPQKVTYGTEAGQFQRAGVQSIICGPGDIAQAHSPNEWIELEQLSECERFFEAILDWASAK